MNNKNIQQQRNMLKSIALLHKCVIDHDIMLNKLHKAQGCKMNEKEKPLVLCNQHVQGRHMELF